MKTFFSLKLITRSVSIVAFVLTAVHLISVIMQLALHHKPQLTADVTEVTQAVVGISFSTIALFIAFRSRHTRGRYLYALFISCIALNAPWVYEMIPSKMVASIMITLETIVSGFLFVLADQSFPKQITPETVKDVIASKLLKKYLIWLLRPANLWGYALIWFILGSITYINVPVGIAYNLMIFFTGLCYLYINYNSMAVNSRNSILWLFWGVLSLTILYAFRAMLSIFVPGEHEYLALFFVVSGRSIAVIMIFMSVFFADSFDTGFIIKRTIVDGLLFLLVVLIYNVTEHYLLHLINEHFEINNAFLSSVLSGVLVLGISPLHHRLEVFLDHKFKRHTHGQHQDAASIRHN